MERWMQQLKETYVRMLEARLTEDNEPESTTEYERRKNRPNVEITPDTYPVPYGDNPDAPYVMSKNGVPFKNQQEYDDEAYRQQGGTVSREGGEDVPADWDLNKQQSSQNVIPASTDLSAPSNTVKQKSGGIKPLDTKMSPSTLSKPAPAAQPVIRNRPQPSQQPAGVNQSKGSNIDWDTLNKAVKNIKF